MKRINVHLLIILIGALIIALNPGALLSAVPQDSTRDTTQADTAKSIPGLYKNVDIKIVYPWKEDEPEICENVTCQLIRENNVPVELNIFHKDCTDKIKIKPGLLTFEIRDHRTKKLIAKGP